MINFPLYAVRKYECIFFEGDFKVIQTAKTRYVLDIPSLGGDYSERRMEMLKMKLPYRSYPLSKRITMLSQMVEHRKQYKTYIDADGKLVTWNPKNYHKALSYLITEKWVAKELPRLCFAIEPSCEIYDIDLPNYVAKYARVVHINNRRILYDVTEERMPDSRVKI